MNKQVKQFLKDIERRGWTWEHRRGGHLRLRGPHGEIVFASNSPSDGRALENIRRDIRRVVRERKERERG